MTNLLATIVFTLTTNWTTTSVERPVYNDPPGAMLAVVRVSTLHQCGQVMSNTVARIEWKGKTADTVLESVAVGEPIHRTIAEPPYDNLFTQTPKPKDQ